MLTPPHHFSLTPADIEALAVAPRAINVIPDTFDYSAVIVPKPWGSERLWVQTADYAAWLLSIRAEQSTSLHCHEHKRTVLVVVSGTVLVSTLNNERVLRAGDAVVIDPKVFHSTKALLTLDGYTLVIEVESPALKSDLVRLRDSFGRVGWGYEKPETYVDGDSEVMDGLAPHQVNDHVARGIGYLVLAEHNA